MRDAMICLLGFVVLGWMVFTAAEDIHYSHVCEARGGEMFTNAHVRLCLKPPKLEGEP